MPLRTEHHAAVSHLCARLFEEPGRLIETIEHPVDGPFVIKPHAHAQTLQLDVIDGCGGTIRQGGKDIELRGLCLLVHYPAAEHGYRLTRGEVGAGRVHHVKLRVNTSWPAVVQRIWPTASIDLPHALPITQAAGRITRATVMPRPTPLVISHLAALLSFWPGEGLSTVEADAVQDDRDLDEAIRLIERRIAMPHAAPPSVAEMAKAAHLSPRHFSRRVRLRFGCTPLDLVDAHRLDRAKSLLLGGRRQVQEVADDLGFAHVAAFSRWFRQHAAITPSEYRQDHGAAVSFPARMRN